MANSTTTGETLSNWVETAVQRVQDRLSRVSRALESAGIPYAIVGGNAVQAWVKRADESLVRSTRDVDIAIERSRLPDAITVLEAQGFIYRHAKSIDMFLDGPDAKARDAVHVIFASEKVRESDIAAVPSIDEWERLENVCVVTFDGLVRMKLTSYRDKDRTHLRDMIEAGLLDETWPARLQPELGERLQAILDDPLG